MENLRWPQLSEDELTAFLGNGGTGVISFSTSSDDSPYSMPVSYGFNTDVKHFHFRLAFPPGSEKETLVTQPVSFVTHDRTDAGWRSVIARGRLRETGEAAIDSSIVEAIRRINIPFFTVFDRPARELDFELFRLAPEDLTGHKQT